MDQRELEHRFRTAWHSVYSSTAALRHATSDAERLEFIAAIIRGCDACDQLLLAHPEQVREIDTSPSDN